jgi:hypothetical protein
LKSIFSKKSQIFGQIPHPPLRTVVGAAKLDASIREERYGRHRSTKGSTNLTWVWDVQDLDFTWADYNPGDGYWDVFAMDMYGDGYTTQKYTAMLQIAGHKPIAIGECETPPTAPELAAQPRWTFLMAWAELVQSGNSVQQIQDLYNATNIITLGQMPGWG